MRSGRLLEILLLLQARGQVTAAELAERLEVSTRTVYRDAEALSSAGVRDRLDMFRRICAAYLTEGAEGADSGDGSEDGEWVVVGLRFPGVPAARTLLSFGGDVEVVSPPEVRADLASAAAEVIAHYC